MAKNRESMFKTSLIKKNKQKRDAPIWVFMKTNRQRKRGRMGLKNWRTTHIGSGIRSMRLKITKK
ncbi:MAG: 50S ribosomal protein L39e [Candidatus Diapherotrites archaeon]|nr:50S ribosomal protein L39e [Candidatus Diapherotrites archaeon]